MVSLKYLGLSPEVSTSQKHLERFGNSNVLVYSKKGNSSRWQVSLIDHWAKDERVQ